MNCFNIHFHSLVSPRTVKKKLRSYKIKINDRHLDYWAGEYMPRYSSVPQNKNIEIGDMYVHVLWCQSIGVRSNKIVFENKVSEKMINRSVDRAIHLDVPIYDELTTKLIGTWQLTRRADLYFDALFVE